ncbi:Sodium/calcium exchanger protein-domain-containing protein [Obelidium mucronatum]|nr:Sodium/calcium exchanger protein-domain-containing protein [Obelidium mucronatum]
MAERQPLLNTAANHHDHDHHEAHEVTVASSFVALWKTNLWFNVFGLIFIPLGIASSVLGWSDVSIFALNFLAIIPLAKMLDFATDQLASRTNETIGGLLNATFGNAVELILSIMALREGLLHVVQASMIGSILSNLLLVLGFCFLCGGLFPFEFNKFQEFDADKANVSTGLLSLTFLGFLVPCVLRFEMPSNHETEKTIVNISRGISIILLIIYFAYLVFQLYTNPDGLKVTPKRRNDAETQQPAEDDDDEEDEEPETVLWVALGCSRSFHIDYCRVC